MFQKVSSILLLIFLTLTTTEIQAGKNVNSVFGVGYAVPGYAEKVSEMGARWVKIPSVCWGRIEPTPPQDGKHFYRWKHLDGLIKEYQNAGFHIQIVIKSACPWGTKEFASPPESWRRSYPPKKEHWDDYYQFVYNLVERYDGDGYRDMPGLRYPIRYYEIESEAQHHIFWAGTVGEYCQLLKTAYKAAKNAHPEIKIILAGINFGSLFDDNPSPEDLMRKVRSLPKKYRREISFIRETLAMVNYYDVVDYHYNRDYTGAYSAVKWLREEMKKYGCQKEIWAGDTASVLWITDVKYGDILKILMNPSHPHHRKVSKWFRAEQAKLSVKKIIVAVGLGIKKVILESIRDFPSNAYTGVHRESWFLAGFFNEDKTPRPVFYAYLQLVKKLENFQRVESLLRNGTYIYRVIFPDRKPMYIVWSEGKSRRIRLDIGCSHVKLEKVITSETGKLNVITMKVKEDKVALSIDSTPVFVECVDEKVVGEDERVNTLSDVKN